jgi:PAS domain S-box-containing protein
MKGLPFLLWRNQRKLTRFQPRSLPLRLVLTIPFGLLTVGTTGMVGFLSWQNGEKTVNNLANQLMAEVSDRTNLYLNQYLETPHLINRLNARAIRFNQIDISDSQKLQQHFLQQIQEFDSTRIRIGNPQGGMIGAGNDERGFTVSSTINFVKGTLQVHSVDSRGNRQKQLVNQQNYDVRQRPFYQKAVEAKQPIWTPVYAYVPASRGLGIAASYPLYNQANQLQGVLSTDLTLATINDFLRKLEIGTHGEVFIMERSGLLVASSSSEPPFTMDAAGVPTQRLAIESQEPLIRLTAQHLLTQFEDFSQIKTTQYLHFDLEGEQQFLLVNPYQDEFGLDWLVVTVVPRSDFMTEINASTRTMVLLSFGALAGAIALGWWLSQRIVQPIQQLGQASSTLATGKPHQAMRQDSQIAELQILNHAFDQMAEQLQQSFDRVQSALQESEEKFTKVFRTSPDPIAIATPEGKYLEINDAFVAAFGYAREEVLEHHATEVGLWVDMADRDRYVQLVQSGQRVRNLEFAFRHKSGRVLTVLFSAETIDLHNQRCIIGVAKEISDRKQAELELQKQQELRETIYNGSTDALFLVNSETLHITDCNRRAVELFEASSKAELIGIEGHTLQRHSFSAAEIDEILAEMQQKGFWSREIEYVTRKGNFFWGNLAAKPVQIANQNIHLVRVTDISDRKQAEAALRQNEARFQKLANASPCVIYTIVEDVDGPVRFEYASPAFEEIHEIPVAEVVQDASRLLEQIHPDDRAGYQQVVNQCAETMQPFRHEWRIITPSGKIKWLQANSRPEQRENGELVWHGVVIDITDLKQAEESLRQSEERTRAILTAIPDLMKLYSVDGIYLDTIKSNSIIDLIADDASAIGKSLTELVPPEIASKQIQLMQQAIATGEVQVYEQQIPIQDVVQHEEVRVVPCGNDTALLLIRNINDRVQAEEALRRSEATKNQILNAIPDLIIWMTADGYCLDLVDGNSITNLYEKSQAVGSNLYDLLPFDLAQMREQAIQQALQTGKEQLYEQQLIIQGEIHHEEVRIVGVGEDRVLVIVRDITARKRAEEALRQSEERFRSAFQDAPIGMALIDMDDRWIKVNPMLCNMLGYSESELLTMNVSSLVHSEDINLLQHCIQQALSNQQDTAQAELRYHCNEGRIAWVKLSLSIVRNAQKQPLYYVAQIQDITEQYAIDRMKDEFISIVSHELRTPLTAIQGFLGLLNTGIYDDRPEKAKRMIELALSNSDRLVRLVNDILDLERLSSGKAQLVMEVCQAEALMQRAVEGVQSIADQALVSISILPTTAQVWASPDTIIQTLTNLLSNAIKFSPPDSEVIVSAQLQADMVLFEVKDHGRGIPRDKLETIFGRFQQVDVSDSRQKGGTGLGLAICQSIVQQHGGNIWAESTLGEGSTFYFTLPMSLDQHG